MRLLVFGGRTFRNMAVLHFGLCQIVETYQVPIDLIIHGDADGADRLAQAWADYQGVPTLRFPAKWSEIDIPGARVRWGRHGFYNAAAGVWRNAEMLEVGKPTHYLGMPGGTGTADMLARCRGIGLPGLVVS